jgi:hypothetical protein
VDYAYKTKAGEAKRLKALLKAKGLKYGPPDPNYNYNKSAGTKKYRRFILTELKEVYLCRLRAAMKVRPAFVRSAAVWFKASCLSK